MIISLARSTVGLTFPLFHARMQKTERANPNDQDRRRTDGTHGLARRGELTSGELERRENSKSSFPLLPIVNTADGTAEPATVLSMSPGCLEPITDLRIHISQFLPIRAPGIFSSFTW